MTAREMPGGLEQEELGKNVDIRITFARHSQKASGEIMTDDRSEISKSSLSPGGHDRSRHFGRVMKKMWRDPQAAGVTSVDRTSETIKGILEGAEASDRTIRTYLGFEAFKSSLAMNRAYDEIVNVGRQNILRRQFHGKKLSELSPDDQEYVMEISEEPAVEWWLDHKRQRFDEESESPRETAARVAYKLQRFINLPKHLPNGKEIDLITAGHKTSTEAFLVYTLLAEGEEDVNEEELKPAEKLRRLGGSMKILDSWDLQIRTDEHGEETVQVELRHKMYRLDLKMLRELAEEGRELFEKEEKLIDRG